MAFKFNFGDSGAAFTQDDRQVAASRPEDRIPKRDACMINPKLRVDVVKKLESKICEINFGSYKIKHLSAPVAINYLKECDSQWKRIFEAEASDSDLVPGVYEGGMKIWECSLDLAKFLYEHNCVGSRKTVLELGCGAAIPGVFAYMRGSKVTFQDYNEEVLNSVTIANIVLNTSEAEWPNISKRCRFIAGDWESIMDKFYGAECNSLFYDVILTSETIYAKENHRKLLALMKHALKSDGVIYLAAKQYYFGVGGGTEDFVAMLDEDGALETTSCYEIYTGGVEREIYVIKFT